MRAALCPISGTFATKFSPQHVVVHPQGELTTSIFHSVLEIPAKCWTEIAPEENRLFGLDYLTAIETANSHLDFRYVIFYQDKLPVALAIFQIIPFDLSQTQDLVGDELKANWLKRFRFNIINRVRKWVSQRKVRILLNGNAFVTGDHGFYHIPGLNPEVAYAKLKEVIQLMIRQERKQGKVRAALVKDFYLEKRPPDEEMESGAYHSFRVDPNMILTLQPDWFEFDQYLSAMTSKYRQRVKSAYKKSKALECRSLSASEVVIYKERINQLFYEVLREETFHLTSPGENYFQVLKERLGDDFLVFGYFLNGNLIAFKTLIKGKEWLEAHFIGYEPSQNKEYKLYQRMLYDMVKTGIELRMKKISFGRTALEIKSTVGAIGKDLNLYMKLTQPLFNRLSRSFVRNVKADPWTPRHPFKQIQSVTVDEK